MKKEERRRKKGKIGRETTFRSQQPRNSRANFQLFCETSFEDARVWCTRPIETPAVLGNASRRIQHFYREHPRLCATLSQNRPREREERMKRADKGTRARGRISMSNSFISRRTSHGNPGFRSRFVSSLWLFSFSAFYCLDPSLCLAVSKLRSSFFPFTVYFTDYFVRSD